MCGIFGIVVGPGCDVTFDTLRATVDRQFKLSDSRGKEAAGWAVRTAGALVVFKQPLSGVKLTRQAEHRRLFRQAVLNGNGGAGASVKNPHLHPPLAVIGHSRLVTNGRQTENQNNQPVVRDGLAVVHNGIIVNEAQLWRQMPDIAPASEVDTEVLLCLIARALRETGSVARAVQQAFGLIEGAASIAVLFGDRQEMVLATNTGSLYVGRTERGRPIVFASERYILQKLARSRRVASALGEHEIMRVNPGQGYVVSLASSELTPFELGLESRPLSAPARPAQAVHIVSVAGSVDPAEAVSKLKRCRRCVLPETFPFIQFDAEGVCQFCRNHQPMKSLGHEALVELVAPYRSADGSPDCVIAFSGGRDSSYGLHYAKTRLGLHPIAFTYDWGMVTDLARRNQSRICGKLGVEHILISADIRRKRLNVRKNVEAWLQRPHLGMIPLFMAGDKQFFYYANRLRKQTGVKLVLFAVNPLEKTGFKSGFCGVDEAGQMYFRFSPWKKLKISGFYLGQYLRNLSYWNTGLVDTAWAYLSAFLIAHDYLMFYDYVRWDEQEISRTLHDEYNWEGATDTHSTWRIGDGTAAFYNYIYYTVAGFTENDTFRSNQIREGALGREEALALVDRDNRPRWESMQWYAETIGFDLSEAVAIINAIPKLYRT